MKRRACLLLLAAAACAKEPEPMPLPAATATPAPPSAALRPLTSRDAGDEHASPAPGSLPPGHPPVGPAASAGPAISGRIELAPGLGKRAGAAVYVIARNASQQIVAVRKEEASRFPLAFTISGADAMTEGTSFEGPLDLTARLSVSGDAAAAKGDVEGVALGLKPGARDVRIVLDSVRQ